MKFKKTYYLGARDHDFSATAVSCTDSYICHQVTFTNGLKSLWFDPINALVTPPLRMDLIQVERMYQFDSELHSLCLGHDQVSERSASCIVLETDVLKVFHVVFKIYLSTVIPYLNAVAILYRIFCIPIVNIYSSYTRVSEQAIYFF